MSSDERKKAIKAIDNAINLRGSSLEDRETLLQLRNKIETAQSFVEVMEIMQLTIALLAALKTQT